MKDSLLAPPNAVALLLLALPLLVGGAACAGDTMYRWSEPDGSLTYSPTAPTDGTPYDVVDPMTLRPPSDDVAGGITRAGPPVGVRTAAAFPPVDSRAAPPRPADPERPVRTASESTPDAAALRPSTAAAASPTPAPAATEDDRALASNAKEQRCEELGKRVVSLERRLRTPLTPEAMDDTVVQMARYQRSVERHCR